MDGRRTRDVTTHGFHMVERLPRSGGSDGRRWGVRPVTRVVRACAVVDYILFLMKLRPALVSNAVSTLRRVDRVVWM